MNNITMVSYVVVLFFIAIAMVMAMSAEIITDGNVESSFGRVATWTYPVVYGKQSYSPNYITKTTYISEVNDHLDALISSSEIAVILKPKEMDENRKEFSKIFHPSIQKSLKSSKTSTCYTNVYQHDDYMKDSSKNSKIESTITNSVEPTHLNVHDFIQTIKSSASSTKSNIDSTILSDNKPDIFEIELDLSALDDLNMMLYEELENYDPTSSSTSSHDNIESDSATVKSLLTFIVIDQPSVDAYAPKLLPSQRGLIGDSKLSIDSLSIDSLSIDSSSTNYSTNTGTGIYYKPEGAEYAIYYADTYLYITPDIFTGIMTSLFIVGVLLVGFYCMSNIQGASSFVAKPIPLGKEY